MKLSTTNGSCASAAVIIVVLLVTSSFHSLHVNAFQIASTTRPGPSSSIGKPSFYDDNRKQSSWRKQNSIIATTSNNRLYAAPPDSNSSNNSDYQQSNDDSDAVVSVSPSSSFPSSIMIASLAMIGIPFMSVVFPWLLQTARSLPANSSQQLAVITALFVGNRVYLYGMATIIIVLAATRGTNDSLSLGKRVTDLTEELLYRPNLSLTKTTTASGEETENEEQQITAVTTKTAEKTPKLIQDLKQSGFEESLDGVSSETQALVLPLLVSFLLAASIFFLPFWNGGDGGADIDMFQNTLVQDLLKEYLPVITQIWNAGILTVFCKSELRRLGFEIFNIGTTTPSEGDEESSLPMGAIIEWGLAIGITAIACFTPLWQAQNFVNMSLAILVSRVIQLDRFPAIVGALTLLTLYDVTSVFLIPAAGATAEVMMTTSAIAPAIQDAAAAAASSSLDVHGAALIGSSDMLLSAAGDSAMGSVAVQKLTSGTFQPGLLVTKIDPKTNLLGGALGLGDAVFPSILATFVRRFDLSKQQQQQRIGLFPVAIGGYLLGCTACEFVPAISTSGLPALALIIPFMLGSVVAGATVSGELGQLWNYNPKKEKETEELVDEL